MWPKPVTLHGCHCLLNLFIKQSLFFTSIKLSIPVLSCTVSSFLEWSKVSSSHTLYSAKINIQISEIIRLQSANNSIVTQRYYLLITHFYHNSIKARGNRLSTCYKLCQSDYRLTIAFTINNRLRWWSLRNYYLSNSRNSGSFPQTPREGLILFFVIAALITAVTQRILAIISGAYP